MLFLTSCSQFGGYESRNLREIASVGQPKSCLNSMNNFIEVDNRLSTNFKAKNYSEDQKFVGKFKKFKSFLRRKKFFTAGKLQDWVTVHMFFPRSGLAINPKHDSYSLLRKVKSAKASELGSEADYSAVNSLFQKYVFGKKEIDLSVEGLTKVQKDLVGVPWYLRIFGKKNPGLRTVDSEVKVSQKFISERLKPDLGSLKKSGDSYVFNPSHSVEAVKETLEALIKEHADNIKNAINVEKRVRAHTDFMWQFLQLQPLSKGNEEVAQLMLSSFLAKEGVNPPIMNIADYVIKDKNGFFESVIEGVHASEYFMKDVEKRIQIGLDPYSSPVPLLSILPEKVAIKGNKKSAQGEMAIDQFDYFEFVRKNPEFKTEVDRMETYVEHMKKWSLRFENSRKEIDEYQLRYIPESMQRNHFKVLSVKPEAWHARMARDYTDGSLFRGEVSRKTFSDKKVLDYFTSPQLAHLSMRSSLSNGRFARWMVKADMKSFNSYIDDPKKLFKYVYDHMTEGGLYLISIFSSTSKNTHTAKRFSKGFLLDEAKVVGQKSQIHMEFKRPKYGVADLNRLAKISDEVDDKIKFRSQFPRQEEVSLAGGISPDSMTRIEIKDVEVGAATTNSGEFIADPAQTTIERVRVFERDASKPNIIHVSTQDEDGNVKGKKSYEIFRNFLGFISYREI